MEKLTTFKVTNLQTNEVLYKEMHLCEFADPRATSVWLAALYRRAFDRGLAENHKFRIEKVK